MEKNYTPRDWDAEGNWGTDSDGNVMPLGDFENYKDLPDRPPVSIEPNLKERNYSLQNLADKTAAARRAEGASIATEFPTVYRTRRNAEMIARRDMASARQLGRQACELCLVSAECEINFGIVVSQTKNDAKKREYFRKNLEKSNESVSYDLCQDMLKKPL